MTRKRKERKKKIGKVDIKSKSYIRCTIEWAFPRRTTKQKPQPQPSQGKPSMHLCAPRLKSRENTSLFTLSTSTQLTNTVNILTLLDEALTNSSLRSRVDSDNHTDTAVEGASHLSRGHITGTLEPREDRGLGPSADVDLGRQGSGQHTGDVLDETAAGDVSQTLDGSWVGGEGVEDGLDVDAGRGEEGSAEGEGRRRGLAGHSEGGLVGVAQASALDDLADERVAV